MGFVTRYINRGLGKALQREHAAGRSPNPLLRAHRSRSQIHTHTHTQINFSLPAEQDAGQASLPARCAFSVHPLNLDYTWFLSPIIHFPPQAERRGKTSGRGKPARRRVMCITAVIDEGEQEGDGQHGQAAAQPAGISLQLQTVTWDNFP